MFEAFKLFYLALLLASSGRSLTCKKIEFDRKFWKIRTHRLITLSGKLRNWKVLLHWAQNERVMRLTRPSSQNWHVWTKSNMINKFLRKDIAWDRKHWKKLLKITFQNFDAWIISQTYILGTKRCISCWWRNYLYLLQLSII